MNPVISKNTGRKKYKNTNYLITDIGVCLPQIMGYIDDVPEPMYVQRVVNGEPAKLGDIPYQLAFKFKSKGRNTYLTFCGGSIIGPDKIISAAHCFEEKKSAWMKSCGKGTVSQKTLKGTFAVAGNLMNKARYSISDSTENGQWRRIKSMLIPPLYEFPKNDISVGITSRKFNFNNYVSAIPFATTYRDYVGTCLVSGYGRIDNSEKNPKLSEILRYAHLDVFSTSTCTRLHRKNMRKFVCTSDIISDVGKGDSGGPLVCTGTNDPAETSKGVLVGVVSGNRHNTGSFFTRVSSYHSFITNSNCCFKRGNVIVVFMCLFYYTVVLLF